MSHLVEIGEGLDLNLTYLLLLLPRGFRVSQGSTYGTLITHHHYNIPETHDPIVRLDLYVNF